MPADPAAGFQGNSGALQIPEVPLPPLASGRLEEGLPAWLPREAFPAQPQALRDIDGGDDSGQIPLGPEQLQLRSAFHVALPVQSVRHRLAGLIHRADFSPPKIPPLVSEAARATFAGGFLPPSARFQFLLSANEAFASLLPTPRIDAQDVPAFPARFELPPGRGLNPHQPLSSVPREHWILPGPRSKPGSGDPGRCEAVELHQPIRHPPFPELAVPQWPAEALP